MCPLEDQRKKRRYVMEVEDLVKGNQLSRAQKSVTCSKCNKSGHNARTCKGQKAGGAGSAKVKAGGSQTLRNVGGARSAKVKDGIAKVKVGGAGSVKVKDGSAKVKAGGAGSAKVKTGVSKKGKGVP
ncbi:unnamed protein product [Lactuca saligna]|uniref:CCHC-type domain-containing protein n=1 Tax=Lactuca saligna TaxID=75948 RepID=A0AA35ZDR8_LACSI|nr:unnamed protein product [Lactuca saligna]